MIIHNLLITYRGFLRNKASFIINLLGLSTALACAIFIFMWIKDETIHWKHVGYEGDFQVTGIFKDIPVNSSENFDVIFNIQQVSDNDRWSNLWTGSHAKSYFVLRPEADINSVNIRSAPFSLHNARKGGSLTSSIGANSNGNFPSSMFPILTKDLFL